MSITEARNELSETVKSVADTGIPVGITVNGRTQAILAPPRIPGDQGPWLQAAESTPSSKLPGPFLGQIVDDGGIGACLWVHAASGAMIAAIPTGRWDEPGAHFAFYYTHPAMSESIHLDGWTYALLPWENNGSSGYTDRRADVVALFRERASRS